MKVRDIGFIGIPVTDIERSRKFYEGVLGLTTADQMMGGQWLEYNVGSGTLATANVCDDWRPSDDGTTVAPMSCLGNSWPFVESAMAFRQGAARNHPLYGAVTELQRCRRAIPGSTVPAARLFGRVLLCSSVTDPFGYACSSRLTRSENPQPQMASYFRDRTLKMEEVDSTIAELKRANIKFAAEPFETPCCQIAVVQDPDGNKIIIHKLKPENEKGECS